MESSIDGVEVINDQGGITGKVTFYADGHVKVFWVIPKGILCRKIYRFESDFVEIAIEFDKIPKTTFTLTMYIKPQFTSVRGTRIGIKRYQVTIKARKRYHKLATIYNKPEKITTNLCKHPSRYRSKHGSKSDVDCIVKAGSMTPK